MTIPRLAIPVVCALGLFALAAAAAEQPKTIGTFEAWDALTFDEGGGLVCYASSEPVQAEGNYAKRGKVYALVTHRPARKSRGVVTIMAGYAYKAGGDVTAAIGGQTFTLFASGEAAWADDATDPKLVAAMKAGSEMVVRGVSSRGTKTTDTYSLAGFSRAYAAIGKACGVAP
jgi:hypothetical protein